MKTSLLKPFGVASLFATLSLSVPQAQSVSQPQQFSLPSLIPASAGSQLLGYQSVVRPTTGWRNTALYDFVQELHTLPVGKEYNYYRQVLAQRGYLVLSNYNDHRHWEFTLEKTQQNLRLTIAYNPETGTSTMITASGPRVAHGE